MKLGAESRMFLLVMKTAPAGAVTTKQSHPSFAGLAKFERYAQSTVMRTPFPAVVH
jgi:hypothetical protein